MEIQLIFFKTVLERKNIEQQVHTCANDTSHIRIS